MSPFQDLNESQPNASLFDLAPLSMDKDGLSDSFQTLLRPHPGPRPQLQEHLLPAYEALAITLRDRLMERWKRTRQAQDQANCKRTVTCRWSS